MRHLEQGLGSVAVVLLKKCHAGDVSFVWLPAVLDRK
jgi:hypothetical protein